MPPLTPRSPYAPRYSIPPSTLELILTHMLLAPYLN